MGYLGAKIDLSKVRSEMAKSRTYMSHERLTPKQKRFCEDTQAFNWVCRHYRYNYTEWNGNVENIYHETYGQYYDILTNSESYSYVMRLLKEGSSFIYPDSERLWLIKEAKVLRNRYR